MSVLMTLQVAGNPQELERRAAANPEGMQAILEKAKGYGVISHRFYGAANGQIMVVDEWKGEEGFRAFFEASPEIQDLMGEVGVTASPQITFWRQLESHDAYDRD